MINKSLQIVDMEFLNTSDEEETENVRDLDLDITENQAEYNYMMAGTEVPEPPDEISAVKYQHLMLNDNVHQKILEVLFETKIKFKLSDFQMIREGFIKKNCFAWNFP